MFNIDFLILSKIVMVDILLGGDNAVVIAMATAALHPDIRKKAIFWGTGLAIFARIVILAAATWLIAIPFIKLAAGLVLIWIAIKLLKDSDDDHSVNAHDKLLVAVKTIAVADIAMSIDNVFAVVGASASAGEHGMYYAIAGIALSIPLIIWGSTLLSSLMSRFPWIVVLGSALLGWIAADMIMREAFIATWMQTYGAATAISAIETLVKTLAAVGCVFVATVPFKKICFAQG